MEAQVLARLAREQAEAEGGRGIVLHIARDDRRLAALEAGLRFFAPDVSVIAFPAWDCVPYDRVSPSPDITARRIAALARLVAGRRKGPHILLTTQNAALQRVPPRAFIRQAIRQLAPGQRIDMARLARRLDIIGYMRTGTVMEPGEYAVRGGILDLFPPGRAQPVRLDFFGDTLETLRSFDPETQRSAARLGKLILLPVSEIAYGEAARRAFRQRYVALFGPVTEADPLYEAVTAGQPHGGLEHWLPLFHGELETLFDYAPGAPLSFDPLTDEARGERLAQIRDHFEARRAELERKSFGAPPYKPVPPSSLFLDEDAWDAIVAARPVRLMTPFAVPDAGGEGAKAKAAISLEGRPGRLFARERQGEAASVFDAVAAHVRALQEAGKRVLIAAWTRGARERLAGLLADHGLAATRPVASWPEAEGLPPGAVGLAVLGLERGFETPDLAVIAEQDILGDRLVRPKRRARKASDVISEAQSLAPGDLVVHVDHGIGRFEGLKTIEAAGAPHDCLELVYRGGDKLFLPVENIELLTRYGGGDTEAELDRLGAASWQRRKARLKKRILDMAERLIAVAARRALRTAPVITPPPGLFEEFCARFPHEETEDQIESIRAVLDDLASGKPMDRLICGDVGFGKTEVALRSAFAAVMSGKQVAVVVPTTLLARQHHATFTERFAGYPVKIAAASRLVAASRLAEIREGLKSGDIDIVIGTHVLLGKRIAFADLGLLIIDEEQHFGVQHKERLKQMREEVHVLTLTATPIPRTLQLALTGVRELSLITTPPLDRLAVRSYVMPFDPMIIREALLRERFRGGQSFYVCPRISDLEERAAFLAEAVPELKVAVAHGQMPASRLDEVMTAFYEGACDILLSTTIIESGLDIPRANTLIVHRADRFGLAQLYQLRGRVGRSKTRAYAYFTYGEGARLSESAQRRLKVLQSLDTLGAGFALASHDLDIRGAGNLLGEQQSGHIREVGFELYQSMLDEAVAALKGGEGRDGAEIEDQWAPQISLGTAVRIPESYVPDLGLRLGLYRRLSRLEGRDEIAAFAEELTDRFGPLPQEVRHLLEIVEIKALCRRAGVAEIDAGPKGAVVGFRPNALADGRALVAFVQAEAERVRLQPDHRLVYKGDWADPARRIDGVRRLLTRLAEMAEAGQAAA